MKYCIRDMIKEKGNLIGTWVDGSAAIMAEVAGLAGYDFIVIDNEHGCHGYPNVLESVRAAELTGMATFFRVPNQYDEEPIKKALDMGASGIMVPNVSNREDAERIVRYSKFAPLGNRGCCPIVRANDYSLKYGWEDYFNKANDEVVVCVIIETADGVENIDEILSVPGIDMVFIGRVDMSVSMGLKGKYGHPAVLAAVEKVIASARAHNVILGITGFNREDAAQLVRSKQYDIVTVGDVATLVAAYKADLQAVKSNA